MSLTQRSSVLTQRPQSHDPDHTWGEDPTVYPWGHSRHAHTFGQLVHAISGRAVFTIHDDAGTDLATHVVDDRSAIWIPRIVWHSARFSPEFAPSAHPLDLDEDEDRARTLVIDSAVRAELLATQWRRDPALVLTRASLATQGQRPATTAPPMPAGSVARTIAQALDRDPADPRDLDEWARTLCTSATSIRRAFKAETGLTWSAWRTQHRLNRAVVLLRSGTRPSRAAFEVGFSEAGLAAAVRRHIGGTPAALNPSGGTLHSRQPR